MFEFKLNQTFLEMKILGRVIKLTLLNIIMMIILFWTVGAFVLCSCCTYTLTDVIDLAYDKVLRLMGDTGEVSVRIQNIHDKTCACDSPWYSPCVVWGNKQVKEDSCNKEGGCEEANAVKGADETETSTGKKCVGSSGANKCQGVCDKSTDVHVVSVDNLTGDQKFNTQ
tara:strand:+ start:553 stop:1059 length:507 start_codon:yes stop_codon:yes gene_type:complete